MSIGIDVSVLTLFAWIIPTVVVWFYLGYVFWQYMPVLLLLEVLFFGPILVIAWGTIYGDSLTHSVTYIMTSGLLAILIGSSLNMKAE